MPFSFALPFERLQLPSQASFRHTEARGDVFARKAQLCGVPPRNLNRPCLREAKAPFLQRKADKRGKFPKGSVNYLVQQSLEDYYKDYVRCAKETHGAI